MTDDEQVDGGRPGGGCPHCPSRAECACPDDPVTCPRGGCPCPPSCPCRKGCLPPWGPDGPDPRQKRGCLVGLLLVVVVVVILILLRSCDDEDGDEVLRTPVTTPRPAAPSSTAAPADPTPPSTSTTIVRTPVPEDLQRAIEDYCLAPDDAGPDASLEDLLGPLPVVETGPEPGGTAPPLDDAERDPALRIEHAGALVGGCEPDEPYAAIVGVLGGPPDAVQVEVGVRILESERVAADPDPLAPGGLGQRGGWDHLFVPDGDEVLVYDSGFLPLEVSSMVERPGAAFVLIYRHDEPGPFEWLLQVFQRDGDAETSPVGWSLATGSHPGG